MYCFRVAQCEYQIHSQHFEKLKTLIFTIKDPNRILTKNSHFEGRTFTYNGLLL